MHLSTNLQSSSTYEGTYLGTAVKIERGTPRDRDVAAQPRYLLVGEVQNIPESRKRIVTQVTSHSCRTDVPWGASALPLRSVVPMIVAFVLSVPGLELINWAINV